MAPLGTVGRFQMINRLSDCAIGVAAVVAVVWLRSPPAAAQVPPEPAAGCPGESALFHPCALAKAKTFSPRRTPDDKPDLQGLWRGPAAGTEIHAFPAHDRHRLRGRHDGDVEGVGAVQREDEWRFRRSGRSVRWSG